MNLCISKTVSWHKCVHKWRQERENASLFSLFHISCASTTVSCFCSLLKWEWGGSTKRCQKHVPYEDFILWCSTLNYSFWLPLMLSSVLSWKWVFINIFTSAMSTSFFYELAMTFITVSLIFGRDEYRTMKWQWQSMTKTQEKNFSEFRERKHLIGKYTCKIRTFIVCMGYCKKRLAHRI